MTGQSIARYEMCLSWKPFDKGCRHGEMQIPQAVKIGRAKLAALLPYLGWQGSCSVCAHPRAHHIIVIASQPARLAAVRKKLAVSTACLPAYSATSLRAPLRSLPLSSLHHTSCHPHRPSPFHTTSRLAPINFVCTLSIIPPYSIRVGTSDRST